MTKEYFKKLKRTLRFYVIKTAISLISLLPTSKIKKIGRLITKLFYLLGRKDINKARELLPKEFEKDKETIIRKMVENVALLIPEVVLYDKSIAENPNYCRFENWEIIDNILKQNKFPIILTCHFGNWELLGYSLVKAGFDLNVIARSNNLQKMTDLINSYRKSHGVNVIMHDNILEASKLAREGKVPAILADLNAREYGYQVDFFGRNASFYSAPVIISMRSKMPLVPVFPERQPDGTHIMRVLPPIEWHKDDTMRDKVQKIAKVYEEGFRRRPDLWCWFHDRYEFAEKGKI